MLKISKAPGAEPSVTLKLGGRVGGLWVGELHRTCEPVLGEGGTLYLDLEDVSFVDKEGVIELTRLKSRGAAVMRCSPFVTEQLKSGTPG